MRANGKYDLIMSKILRDVLSFHLLNEGWVYRSAEDVELVSTANIPRCQVFASSNIFPIYPKNAAQNHLCPIDKFAAIALTDVLTGLTRKDGAPLEGEASFNFSGTHLESKRLCI
jgi:hypothetical protein